MMAQSTLNNSSLQMIEALDMTVAMDTVDDTSTTLTAEDVIKIFSELRKKALASSARVTKLPSTELSMVDLEAAKKSLQARLEHLRSAGDLV